MKSVTHRKNSGFTLVELIVVIAILGVLMAVLVPQYIQYVAKAKAAVCNANCGAIARQLNIALVISDGVELTPEQIASETGFTVKNATLEDPNKRICPTGGRISYTYNDRAYTLSCSEHGIADKNYNDALDAANKAADKMADNMTNDNYRDEYVKQISKDFLADQSILDLAKDPKLPAGAKYVVPYFVKTSEGSKKRTPIMYVGDTGAKAGTGKTPWNAYMICFEGKWYQSVSKDSNGKPTTNGMADYTWSTCKEVETDLTNTNKWKLVS